MSTLPASRYPVTDYLPSDDLSTPIRHPRRKRLFAVGALLFLLSVVLSIGVLVFSPAVLEAMSAIVLKPQAGAIPWNGHDRITVAIMGLTSRTPSDPPRTDTLLLMDIDPSTHHVHMLSVPRDLWEQLPDYNGMKLASVYTVGGPRLTSYVLERDYHIPVDYTITFTFWGFTKLIDAMGGVDVNVPQELKDPTYPCLTGFDYCPIDIKPGQQHMNGATALEFVRERHALAQEDLARVQDQQAFSEAVKRTLLSPRTWPRYPAILSALKQSLITNIPWNDLPALGVQYGLSRSVTHDYINIQNGLVQPGWSNDGQSILTPTTPTAITDLAQRLFTDSTIAQENATVAVLNGSTSAGLASDVQSTLQGLGFHAVLAGNADSTSYAHAVVIRNTAAAGSADYTARRLQRMFNADLISKPVPGQTAQVVLILGNDFPAP